GVRAWLGPSMPRGFSPHRLLRRKPHVSRCRQTSPDRRSCRGGLSNLRFDTGPRANARARTENRRRAPGWRAADRRTTWRDYRSLHGGFADRWRRTRLHASLFDQEAGARGGGVFALPRFGFVPYNSMVYVAKEASNARGGSSVYTLDGARLQRERAASGDGRAVRSRAHPRSSARRYRGLRDAGGSEDPDGSRSG